MDRLKLQIPTSLLDLFVDYSISNKIFDNKEEITLKNNNYQTDKNINKNAQYVNKYDEFDPQRDTDYLHYFQRRDQFKKHNNIQEVFNKLKLKADAKPFYPRNVEEEQLDRLKTKLSEIDPSRVKEFVPKNFKVSKKE